MPSVFSVAAIINAHKFSGLNKIHVLSYSSRGQKSDLDLKELKPRVGRATFLSEALGRISFLASLSHWQNSVLGSCSMEVTILALS